MAIAGDIVIKLAADFAQFAQGMDAAARKLDEFGKAATETGTKLDDFTKKIGGGLKALGVAGGIAAVVNEIKKLAEAAEQAAIQAEKMAQQYGLTSEQVQALQLVSEKSGKSMEDLAKIGKANAEWLDRVTVEAKEAGMVIDSQYTKAIKQAADASSDLQRRLMVLFAQAVAGARSWVSDALDRMRQDLDALSKHSGLINTIEGIIRMLSVGGSVGAGQLGRLEQISAVVENARKAAEDARAKATPVGPYGVMDLPKRQAEAEAAEKAYRDALIMRSKFIEDEKRRAEGGAPTITIPPLTVTATKTGGGGTTEDDTIEAQIRRYKALKENADATYASINKNRAMAIDDLQRELAVQQKVADIVEKFAAKHVTIDDDQRKRLTEAVRANEAQRAVNEKLLQDAERAAELERALGDGTAARTKAQEDLNRALASGRLSQEAFNRETRRGTEALEEQARQAKRFDDNLGSLAAGFEGAAARFARSNDLFSVGEQAFAGLTTAMADSLDVLVGKSQKSFDEIAYSFAKMLADMAMRAALSQVFSTILSAITASPNLAGGAVTDTGRWPARASGGPVAAGQGYVVGERGPELFVPAANGRIIPNGASAGGDNISISIDMSGGKTEGATDPTKAIEFGRKLQVAIKDVIGNERRPGGMLYTRGSG